MSTNHEIERQEAAPDSSHTPDVFAAPRASRARPTPSLTRHDEAVTDPAVRIGYAVLSALRDVAPSNDTPKWMDLAAEARRRGMGTSALRAWCLKHDVPIREDSHRRAWVSPVAIDRAVEGLPSATRAASRRSQSEQADSLDKDIDAQSQHRGRR